MAKCCILLKITYKVHTESMDAGIGHRYFVAESNYDLVTPT